jgi:hypothetical protein
VKRLLCPCPIRFVSKSWKRIESRVPRAPVLVLQAGTLADPPPETLPPARSSYRPVRTARRSQAPSSKPGARSASCSGRRRPCSRFHCPGKKINSCLSLLCSHICDVCICAEHALLFICRMNAGLGSEPPDISEWEIGTGQ